MTDHSDHLRTPQKLFDPNPRSTGFALRVSAEIIKQIFPRLLEVQQNIICEPPAGAMSLALATEHSAGHKKRLAGRR